MTTCRSQDCIVINVVAVLTALSLVAGCGDTGGNTVEVTPTARRQPASLTVPLTSADIETCLKVATDMPEGKLPEFVPMANSTIDDRIPAEKLIETYRSEYRRMFDPVEQARHWRRNEQLTRMLADHGTTPEDFASLLTRIGCGVAANTVRSQFNLDDASNKATKQLATIISQMNALDQQATNPRVSSVAIEQRRQPLVDQLKSLVALSEFSAILASVPPQTGEVIAQHRDALAYLLPDRGELHMFERTLEAPAVIVPVSHESPNGR